MVKSGYHVKLYLRSLKDMMKEIVEKRIGIEAEIVGIIEVVIGEILLGMIEEEREDFAIVVENRNIFFRYTFYFNFNSITYV